MAQHAKSAHPPTKQARLQIRAKATDLQLIERAASLTHKNISEFVLEQALTAAQQVIAEVEKITLSEADWQLLFDALVNPPKPNKALKDAFKRYQKQQKA